jgi:hypothetical protein
LSFPLFCKYGSHWVSFFAAFTNGSGSPYKTGRYLAPDTSPGALVQHVAFRRLGFL